MALLFHSKIDPAEEFGAVLTRELPGTEFRIWPDIGDPAEIEAAVVWRPPPGVLASLPNLQLICALGAGVDALLGDETLPAVPLVRLVDDHLTASMSEYVILQVMRFHRLDHDYLAQQRAGVWKILPPLAAADRKVGILGMGVLGTAAAQKLHHIGFDVAGWSRSPRRIDGITTFHGPEGLDALLERSEILVCLLPLTPETQDVLNASLFRKLPKGAALINCGRGMHLVEEDLIPALDSGQLSGAALDVFRVEPLPSGHPFWSHPKIFVSPHVASQTNPETAGRSIADNIRRMRSGRPLLNQVDPRRGY